MELAHGGHLTHGMKLNVSGKLYNVASYQVRTEDYLRRHGAGGAPGEGAQAEGDRGRVVGLSAPPRLRRVSPHRRRGRSEAVRRHGALRGPRRGRRAPESGAARRRGHDHDAQDARRPARRPDPLQGGVRAGDRQGGVPRPAGRTPGAHHRGQGRVPADRGQRHLPRPSAADDRQRQGVRRDPSGGRTRRAHRRHRRAPRARRPRHGRAQRPRGRGPPCRGGHHRQPQRDPLRPATRRCRPPACVSARRR